MSKNSICIFCSASNQIDSKYIQIASQCVNLISRYDYSIVYGGSKSGMMGELSSAAKKFNVNITGVFPEGILDQNESLDESLQTIIKVKSMYLRKEVMIQKSDIFLVLPGGFGTLDEFFEVLTLKNLNVHNKPIYILNMYGYWNTLLQLINEIYDRNFAPNNLQRNMVVLSNLEELQNVLA